MVRGNQTKQSIQQEYPYHLVLDQGLPISKPMTAEIIPKAIVKKRYIPELKQFVKLDLSVVCIMTVEKVDNEPKKPELTTVIVAGW